MSDDLLARMEAEAARHIGRGTTDEAYPTVQMLLMAGAVALREARAERDEARALLRELVACEDEHDSIIAARLYGKPHLPEHKARELDHRQRRNEAWRNARQFDAHLRGEEKK